MPSKARRKEIKQKWYQEHKDDIKKQHQTYYQEHKDELSQKHKDYYDENKEQIHLKHYREKRDELKEQSKSLQTKYRQSYRFLCKLVEDNIIPESYTNFESIKNIIQ